MRDRENERMLVLPMPYYSSNSDTERQHNMVLGLTELLKPLRSKCNDDTSAPAPPAPAVEAVLRELRPEKAPLCVVAELQEALEKEAVLGDVHLQRCTEFVSKHLASVRVAHTTAEATPIAMEALRIEGLKAIKKWRAWQAYKSKDSIGALEAFMYSKPDTGSLILELPGVVPDEYVPKDTRRRALTEAVRRIEEELVDLGGGPDNDAEGREFAAFEIVTAFDTLTDVWTEEWEGVCRQWGGGRVRFGPE